MRFYKDGEQEEIFRIFENGGILWFIEKENEYWYQPLEMLQVHKASNYPNGSWANQISLMILSGAFLTKKDALEVSKTITKGGCFTCGHGSTIIESTVTEHEFVSNE